MAVSIAQPAMFKRLAGVANDEFWYEDINVAAGTMVELAAANGDIDTSDNLNIFEAYQKVIVVNGTNLKVADFANTRLTVNTLTTAPTRNSIVTQATSNATMVVDFVSADKTKIYGRTTSGTFVTTGGYTLSGGSMDPTTEVPSAVAEATTTPLWYDYTVYPGGSAGTLPTQAYLGCLYQGRVVLSGDSDYPQQWYMSRQTDPFDYAYVTGGTDAQSPVFGGAADAGESGDIVRALIPYRDEYLIFGCATSMWYLTGNPAQGGEIMELDLTVGIFGANSYCFDGGGNLYFWGTNGLYKTTMPGQPRCVTAIPLPAIVRDEAADTSTHRITLAYDRTRSGVLVCITKLSDGSNSNYFYDLKTETQDKAGGFFPETYPDECGPYSLFYYSANDPANRDLLVGSKDGYIRKFDPTANDDDIGATDQAINSYVTFGPMKLGEMSMGVVSSIVVETAGGQSGGGLTDSSAPTLNMWVGLSSDEIAEKLVANTSPNLAAIIAAPGRNRGAAIKRPVRGAYAGIRVGNSTATETWGLERIVLEGKKAGRIK